jgi:parallel beta-helix repeat protein
MNLKLATILLLVLTLGTGMAVGATLTVDDSDGADYTTIQDAVNNASNGDTIRVFDGTYNENVDVNKRLALIGNGSDLVTVQAFDLNDQIFEVTVDWVTVTGFTVTGATGAAGIRLVSNVDYCNISCNNASGNRYGIYLDSYCTCNEIAGNIVNENSDYGIYLYRSNDNAVTGNAVNGSGTHGVYLHYHSDANKITGNTINDSGSYGIYLYYYSDANEVTGNTVNDSGNHGIYISYGSNSNKLWNNYLNNTQNAYDSCTNAWYNPYGNYYSDYNGTDTD